MDLHIENYKLYEQLVTTGLQTIYTKDLNNQNIDDYWNQLMNIFKDGIETPEVKNMKIHIVWPDDEANLYIVQYMWNLMFWPLVVCSGDVIMSTDLFFERIINKKIIKKYIDKFIRKNMRTMPLILLNQNIDRSIGKFRDLKPFQMYLANTVNFEDTVYLMNKYPEYNESLHLDVDGVPMEDVKDVGMKATKVQEKYIKMDDEDNCLKYSFMAGEGINEKQYKEVSTNIGTKPNGQGGIFPHPINSSFINGGLQNVEDIIVDSSIGRIAQILQKQNVGESGAFARRLGLNNQDTKLYPDPTYACDSKNFEIITITKDNLPLFDMRFYRLNPKGMEYLLDINNDKSKELVGKKLYFRSPMTCESAARGEGICYRCYGNLAYANCNINVGQIAAEQLSSRYTQKLLGAKHLLESKIKKMSWVSEFYRLFAIEYDQIILQDNFDYRKYRIIIEKDDIQENEFDEDSDDQMDERTYLNSFKVMTPQETEITIRTEDDDPIYITNDLQEILDRQTDSDGNCEIKMDKIGDKCLFTIDLQNDELSKVMKDVKNLIDNKKSISLYDRNTILEEFIDKNYKGGIVINAVHFEVILMNQLRDANNILETVDWTIPDAQYNLITLNDSLTHNRSLSVRLQSPKVKSTMTSPTNRYLYKPSNMDLFEMEKPQEFINNEFIDTSNYVPERKIKTPVYFDKDMNDDTDDLANDEDTESED